MATRAAVLLSIGADRIGNHDFDFGRSAVERWEQSADIKGYPHLTRLLNATKFPWLLSNIVDESTGRQPEKFLRHWVTERCGVKIGVIGLVEQGAYRPGYPATSQTR